MSLEWTTVLNGDTGPVIGQKLWGAVAGTTFDMVCGSMSTLPYSLSLMHTAARFGRQIDVCVVWDSLSEAGTDRRIQGKPVAGRTVLVINDPDVPTISVSLTEAGATVAAVLNLGHGPEVEG